MKRKAKPLKMWALVDGSGRMWRDICSTRKALIQGIAGWDSGFPCGYNPYDWKCWRDKGYRAVRVTVREEDTNGR